MRVLFLTHRLPYAPNRGDRIRAYHLLRTIGREAEIDLLSLIHDDEEASHASELRPLVSRLHLARARKLRNVLRAAPALAASRTLTHCLLDSAEVRPLLASIHAAHPPDVVLAYCSGMAQYLFAPELADRPAIVDMVDVDSEKWAELARSANPVKRWILEREARLLREFEARATRRAFATLAINARETAALRSIAPGEHIATVSNGIEFDRFRPEGPPTGRPGVVFCGVMNYAPNEAGALWLAHEVWPMVREAVPGATLTFVGSDPSQSVRGLASESDGIAVTGRVPDVRPYLWDAAVAVAPLLVARGLQNKVLEAVAAGLPCVVTPPVAEGLMPEILNACQVAGDARAFADAIVALLRLSPAARRSLSETAHIDQFGWERQMAPVIDLLKRAASAGVADVAR